MTDEDKIWQAARTLESSTGTIHAIRQEYFDDTLITNNTITECGSLTGNMDPEEWEPGDEEDNRCKRCKKIVQRRGKVNDFLIRRNQG